jgi:hypothetical protein
MVVGNPFSSAIGASKAAGPWRVVGSPKVAAATVFDIVLIVMASRCGCRPTSPGAPTSNTTCRMVVPVGTLRWRWRLDQALAGTDLRRRGDDSPLKVRAPFDMPVERLALMSATAARRLARSVRATARCRHTVLRWDAAFASWNPARQCSQPPVRCASSVLDSGQKTTGPVLPTRKTWRPTFAATIMTAGRHRCRPAGYGDLTTPAAVSSYVGDITLSPRVQRQRPP